MDKLLTVLNLQLFAGEGGNGGAEAGTAETATDAVSTTANGAGTAQAAEAQKETAKDFDAEFDKLIKGDYKDAFTKKTQSIINQRFKETKALQSKLDKASPLLAQIAERLGVSDPEDIDALTKAYTEDDTYIEALALQQGKGTDEVRNDIKRSISDKQKDIELQRYRDEEKSRQEEDENRARFNSWVVESEKLKSGLFPDMDFSAEVQNPEFIRLLDSMSRSGTKNPVETAYKVLHMDNIITSAMATTAQKVSKAAADNTAAGRPAENGISGSVGSTQKVDVNTLSSNDILSILKRVERGEKVSF